MRVKALIAPLILLAVPAFGSAAGFYFGKKYVEFGPQLNAIRVKADRSQVPYLATKGFDAGTQVDGIMYDRSSSQTLSAKMSKAMRTPGIQFAAPVWKSPDFGEITLNGSAFVKFKPELSVQQISNIVSSIPQLKLTTRKIDAVRQLTIIDSNTSDGVEFLDAVNRLAQSDAVEFAEPDLVMTAKQHLVPNDPLFSTQWHLRNTGQFVGGLSGFDVQPVNAWDWLLGNSAVKIGIFDDGVQSSHPDLNVVAGQTFSGEPQNGGGPQTANDNHGTSVAGCAAAITNNNLGVAGVAGGCGIIAVDFGTDAGGGSFTFSISNFTTSLTWARGQGMRVMNMSLGGMSPNSTMNTAFANARAGGVVILASTGNESATSISFPASGTGVLAIGATNLNGALASFSNTGTGIDFVAPGVNCRSTDRTGADGYNTAANSTGDYTYFSGTSASCPVASGVVALILAKNPALSPSMVEGLLRRSVRDMGTAGYDTTYGWGQVQVDGAMRRGFQTMGVSSGLTANGRFQQNAPLSSIITKNAGNNYIVYLFNSSGSAYAGANWLMASNSTLQDVVDANSDGVGDFYFNNGTTTKSYTNWVVNSGATAITSGNWIYDSGLSYTSTYLVDMDQTGTADYVTQSSDGTLRIVLTGANGTILGSHRWIAGLGANELRFACDLDSDGKPEVITENTSTGAIGVVKLNSTATAYSGFAILKTGVRVLGAGDFNGDGKNDLVFYNPTTKAISVGYVSSTTALSSEVSFGATGGFSSSGALPAVSTADLNADGRADLLVRNVTNQTFYSIITSSSTTSPAGGINWIFQPANADANFEYVGDMDGDNRADILTYLSGSADKTVMKVNLNSGGTGYSSATWLLGNGMTDVPIRNFNIGY